METTEFDPNELLDYVPGLREWFRKQFLAVVSRRLLTWAAMGLIFIGAITPDQQDALVNNHVEKFAGILLELGVVAWSLLTPYFNRRTLDAAAKAPEGATMHEVKQTARAIKRARHAAKQSTTKRHTETCIPDTDPFGQGLEETDIPTQELPTKELNDETTQS